MLGRTGRGGRGCACFFFSYEMKRWWLRRAVCRVSRAGVCIGHLGIWAGWVWSDMCNYGHFREPCRLTKQAMASLTDVVLISGVRAPDYGYLREHEVVQF